MFCPECGEPAPPGPLDVRRCAPRLYAKNDASLSILSRFLAWLHGLRNDFGESAKSSRACTGTFQPPNRESAQKDAWDGSRDL
jgi:hypothetical protein